MLSLGFDDLASEFVCAKLWEHLHQTDFDFEWWDEIRRKNIQIDLSARMDRIRENAAGLEALKADLVEKTAGAPSCGLN